jgi:hypothetical protein
MEDIECQVEKVGREGVVSRIVLAAVKRGRRGQTKEG